MKPDAFPSIELAYLPPVSWMALVWSQPVVWLEACENFQKGSYRNRCHIAGPNGLQRLSIPLQKGKHQQTPIREVRIAYNEPWQQVHWRSIRTAYGNAPFFEYYAGALEPFYKKQYAFLFDFNLELLHFLFQKLGWTGETRFTEAYGPSVFRDAVSPGGTPPPDWFTPAPYAQVFTERHGFLADLSVVDLLFCCGKMGRDIIQKSATLAGSPVFRLR